MEDIDKTSTHSTEEGGDFPPSPSVDVGIVLIGRNEGERLKNSLNALMPLKLPVVYVDSNSSDDSVAFAQRVGVDVVELDMSRPFSAGRARNAGFERLMERYPTLDYVQFMDGDCELVPEWLSKARAFLDEHDKVVAVCGRRKERFPEASLFNRLCDLEWDTPTGEAKATGGDFMCRAQAFLAQKGFNESVVAGEEPELCYRWRLSYWKIQRLDEAMTLHDANMLHWSQWWKRNERSGHAYAQGMYLHGKELERFNVKVSISTLVWGLAFPCVLLLLLVANRFLFVLGLCVWLAQVVKIFRHEKTKRLTVEAQHLWAYALTVMMGKVPQAVGWLRFHYRRWKQQSHQILEYK